MITPANGFSVWISSSQFAVDAYIFDLDVCCYPELDLGTLSVHLPIRFSLIALFSLSLSLSLSFSLSLSATLSNLSFSYMYLFFYRHMVDWSISLKNNLLLKQSTWVPNYIKIDMPFITEIETKNEFYTTRERSVWFGLVSLFNGISTFAGYLMLKPFSQKNSTGTI